LLSNRTFNIKIEDIYHGLFDVNWPGRLQILDSSPKIILDVAHNPDGIKHLVKAVQDTFTYKDITVILGIVKNKNYRTMIKNISKIANRIIAVKADTPRALDPKYLIREAEKYNIQADIFYSVAAGLEHAKKKAGKDTLILGTGSHYTVGELINCYKST
jgi:dihydrofolate synthase/folylpolyglutamate synthase